MKIFRKPVTAPSRQIFQQWYRTTTSGRILQNIEASYLQNSLKLTYKQTILQVGLLGSEYVYIPEEFTNQFLTLSLAGDSPESGVGSVIASPVSLPVATCSIDHLILPHVLEFEADPHQVLREIERVLKPEGQLFVICFNPLSMRGLLQYLPRRDSFWHFNFIPHHRILDWMRLLKFDARYHAGFSISTARVILAPRGLLQSFHAYLSLAYAVKGVKRTFTVIPIERAWRPAPGILTGQIAETSLAHDGRET